MRIKEGRKEERKKKKRKRKDIDCIVVI